MQTASRTRKEIPPFARDPKPRDRGLTIATDMLGDLENGTLKRFADYVDYSKIGLSLPLLVERSEMSNRVRLYHDYGIKVMSGGTLIEVAFAKQIVPEVLDKLGSSGFDIVEISEAALSISHDRKQDIIESIERLSMDYTLEVGAKDPRHAPTTEMFIDKIDEAFKLNSQKVVVEAGELGEGVGVYDERGRIKWDVLNEIVGRFGPPNLIFEAPKPSQRGSLILEFGPNVNLASVPLDSVLPLEMQRLGLTSETLGLSPSVQSVDGSPAAKFVYYLVKSDHPIDLATLSQRSGLPKRTLQAALSYLLNEGLVRQISDMSDLRRHKYSPR